MAGEKERNSKDDPKGFGVSRRSFLKGAAVGAVAAGVVVTAPTLLSVVGGTPADATDSVLGALKEPLVAYVRDPSTGELVVMVGTREVLCKDAGLVRSLWAIARG